MRFLGAGHVKVGREISDSEHELQSGMAWTLLFESRLGNVALVDIDKSGVRSTNYNATEGEMQDIRDRAAKRPKV